MRFERIFGLGLSVLDHLLVVDGFTLTGTRTRYEEREVCAGGMVTTALAQAAVLGCHTQLLSVIGDDEEGRQLTRMLRERRVGTRRLLRDPRFPTIVATVLVNRRGGERRFLVSDRRPVERAAPGLDLPALDDRALLLVDGHFSASALRAVKHARRCGAVVIGDFSDARPAFVRLLPYVDHAIVPLEFTQAWGRGDPRQTLHALHDEFGGSPVVTLGRRGALALVDGRVRRIGAERVRVRDTTGAGDVFHGAFAAGLAHGWSVLESLDLAARAASRSCTALGGMGRLLRSREMREIRRRQRA
ncbi:MAG: PfkB family carbohydrate kinase [Proteobacteria bacterium]|nr:PfkB family carbohydrate kinase [Pseudomonadota bacterium]